MRDREYDRERGLEPDDEHEHADARGNRRLIAILGASAAIYVAALGMEKARRSMEISGAVAVDLAGLAHAVVRHFIGYEATVFVTLVSLTILIERKA